ncbi:copper homeostasis protein CutC [Sinomonas sp. P47F7]|uniref:copper homeostasis protein CutC n=1 Tax=Sinomonas sp. P47F7 TaxID=3410987 RepID=UPI003BF5F78B
MDLTQRHVDLELAVQDVDGARIARAVGATRVELCAALGTTGGITPSLGAIQLAVETELPIHVLVRPRPGAFVYSPDELAVAEADARAALRAGAAGVVFGALTARGTISRPDLERLIGAARDESPAAEVTFHRALDTALHAGHPPERLLEELAHCGVTRVLTSGGASEWSTGLPMLRRIVAAARLTPGLEVMAGGGVRLSLLPNLVETGVDAIHASAKHHVNPHDGASAPGQGHPGFEATDARLAAGIANALPRRARLRNGPPAV